jgi:hypothetical protein
MVKSLTAVLAIWISLGPAWIGAGCSGSNGPADSGSEEIDSGDAGTDAGSDTDTPVESGDPGGEEPADCSFVLTPAGASIEACGLRLLAPPNAVLEAKTIQVHRIALSAPPPEGLEQNSTVFALQTDPSDFSFLAYLVVHFPHVTGSNAVWVAKHFPEFGSWGVYETCFKDDRFAGLRTASLGTYTVLRDVAGNDGTGAGEATVRWEQQTGTFALGGVGLAIFQPTPSGTRQVELRGLRLVEGQYQTFRVTFGIDAAGRVGPGIADLMIYDAQGQPQSYVNYPDITPPPGISVTASEPDKNHLVGSMSGTLHRFVDPDWVGMEVSADFDAQVVRHFWGTDDPCYFEP